MVVSLEQELVWGIVWVEGLVWALLDWGSLFAWWWHVWPLTESLDGKHSAWAGLHCISAGDFCTTCLPDDLENEKDWTLVLGSSLLLILAWSRCDDGCCGE